MVVDIVRLEDDAGKLREQVRFFVCDACRSDHANRRPAIAVANLGKLFPNQLESFFPTRWRQLACFANQRPRQALFMVCEIEGVATLDAKEISVGAALVAIVAAYDFHAGVCAPDAQSGLAAITAVRADRTDVLHLPRARFVAVRARGECANRTNVDAHAALFALQVIFFIRGDNRADAAILDAKRPHIHAFAANPHAAVAEDAAWPVKKHHRRPLLLVLVILRLHKLRFGGAVGECHVLQFALAARIAHRAIQRMIAQQHLQHRLPRLLDLIAVGSDDHALAYHRGARGLQLRYLLDLHQAHAARALQREVGLITKRRHFYARALAGLDK